MARFDDLRLRFSVLIVRISSFTAASVVRSWLRIEIAQSVAEGVCFVADAGLKRAKGRLDSDAVLARLQCLFGIKQHPHERATRVAGDRR